MGFNRQSKFALALNVPSSDSPCPVIEDKSMKAVPIQSSEVPRSLEKKKEKEKGADMVVELHV